MDRHHAHAVAAFFEDGRFAGLAVFGLLTQLVNEAAERNAAVGLVAARKLGDVEDVGEDLFAAMFESEPDVDTRGVEKFGDGCRDRHMVARAVQRLKQRERGENWGESIGTRSG